MATALESDEDLGITTQPTRQPAAAPERPAATPAQHPKLESDEDVGIGARPSDEPSGYGAAIEAGIVRGTPGGRAAAAAAETYLPRWLSGAPPSASDDYQQNYARIGRQMEAAQKQYPWTSGISTAVPGVASAIGAPGAAGGSLARTALSGAGWGAATSANEGDQPFDPQDVARRAGWGAFTGASAGTMVHGIGSLALPYGVAGRDAVLAAANRAGVSIPKYIASVSPVMQRIGQLGRSVPVIGEKVADATGTMVKQMGEAAETTAAGATPYSAGASAKEALVNWIGPATKTTIGNAYNNASSLMNQTVKTPLANTGAVLTQLEQARAGYGDELSGQVVKLIQQAQKMPGGLTYEGIKNLRTQIGNMGQFGNLLPSELPAGEVKQLYGALSADLDAAALNSGGPAAQAAHQNANSIAATIADQRKQLTTLLGGNAGGANPESVFAALQRRASGKPGSGDIDLLRQAKASILASNNPGAWNDLALGMVSQLGRKGTGEFSPGQFLTDVGKLAPDAKNELFGATGPLRQSIDDLGTMSERYAQASRFANPSGTGHVIAGAAIAEQVIDHLSTMLSHPVTAGASLAGGLAGGSMVGNWLSKPATAGAVTNFMKQHASWIAQPTEENLNRFRFAAARLSASAASQFGVTIGPGALMAAAIGAMHEREQH